MRFVKRIVNKEDWHNWFAWYPINIIDNGVEYFVWLQTVQRMMVKKSCIIVEGNVYDPEYRFKEFDYNGW